MKVKEKLIRAPVPEAESWRVPLLTKYLEQRSIMEANMEDTVEITTLIDSLCSS